MILMSVILWRATNFAQGLGATFGVCALARAHIEEASAQLEPRVLASTFLAAFFASVTSWDIIFLEFVARLTSRSHLVALAFSSVCTSIGAFLAHELIECENAPSRKTSKRFTSSSNPRLGQGRFFEELSGATKERDFHV